MIRLSPQTYTRQPWKNGRGVTTELWRVEQEGKLLVRLSRAVVVEDGPFSVFPGIQRNLTVLSGPGFRLTGPGIDLRCDPLVPVAFPGDTLVMATDTQGQTSEDFNVMTAQTLPHPQVTILREGTLPAHGVLAIHVTAPGRVNGLAVAAEDLVLTRTSVTLTGDGPMIAVRLSGLTVPLEGL